MLKHVIKHSLRRTRLYDVFRDLREHRRYRAWLHAGRPSPPPHLLKQLTVKEYAARYRTQVFVETGTYMGNMVRAVRDTFDSIDSIELSAEFCDRAARRFLRYNLISILYGDSPRILPQILSDVQQPCLFWPDGHYSGGTTAKGEKETPILEELDLTLGDREEHVILIDDARCFTRPADYPSVGQLKQLFRAAKPH